MLDPFEEVALLLSTPDYASARYDALRAAARDYMEARNRLHTLMNDLGDSNVQIQ